MAGNTCIGLFGTCGGSKWRDAFMERYSALGINFFNPQKDGWCEEDAAIEAEHLANDDILLFPVTDETYGGGSLAETGFSILSAIRMDSTRFVVVMVNENVDPALKVANPVAAKESSRARALVRAHLKKMKYKNVYMVESLDQMMELSLQLNQAVNILDGAKNFLAGK